MLFKFQLLSYALNVLNENSVATNNSIKELTEYIILQDKREQNEKALKADQEKSEALEQGEQELIKEQEESARAEQQSAQADTYEELLTSIDEGIQLNNQLLSVNCLYIGIVIGLLFIKIFVNLSTKIFINKRPITIPIYKPLTANN